MKLLTLFALIILFLSSSVTGLSQTNDGDNGAEGITPAAADQAIERVNALYSEKRYREAIPLAHESIELSESAYGLDHLKTAKAINLLASLYFKQTQYLKAEPLYRRALEIREGALGPQHRALANSIGNLAAVYLALARYDEAEELFERALVIFEAAYGTDHPKLADTLRLLADVQRAKGHTDKAKTLYLRALKILDEQLGPNHKKVVKIRDKLAALQDEKPVETTTPSMPQQSAGVIYKESPDYEDMAITLGDQAQEQLHIAIPVGWKIGAAEVHGSEEFGDVGNLLQIEFDLRIYVPYEQNEENWNELISITHSRRLIYASPYGLLTDMIGNIHRDCEYGRGPNPIGLQEKGHLTITGYYSCTKHQVSGLGVFYMAKVIETENSNYYIERIWRGNKFTPAEIPTVVDSFSGWEAWFSGIVALDSRVAQELELYGSGSGFFVSLDGQILTNNHVVSGCDEVRIAPGNVAEVTASDAEIDLALLKLSAKSSGVATFREGPNVRPGEAVVVIGYPLRGILNDDINVTTGIISGLAGLGGDRRLIQITAPVQAGNSGGPLLDHSGNVVGVVAEKLDALKIARYTGDVPQNVNFAITATVATTFLGVHDVPFETALSSTTLTPADVAERAQDFTVSVECWK